MGVLAAGQTPLNRGFEWHLYEAQLNGLGERKHLQERYEVTFTPELPAGRYFVTAAIDAARAEKEIEIIGGRVTEEQLLLNAGLAKLSGALTPDGSPINRAIEWHIYQGKPNEVKLVIARTSRRGTERTSTAFCLWGATGPPRPSMPRQPARISKSKPLQ